MRELFPGYYRKTENDIKRIWENGVNKDDRESNN